MNAKGKPHRPFNCPVSMVLHPRVPDYAEDSPFPWDPFLVVVMDSGAVFRFDPYRILWTPLPPIPETPAFAEAEELAFAELEVETWSLEQLQEEELEEEEEGEDDLS